MLKLYTWPTANGRKVHIMLEETGIPFELCPINIYAGDQHSAAYSSINPNRKIPAIVDVDPRDGRPVTIFESGAILIYLSELANMLLPQSGGARYDVLKWLMFQMSAIGPMLGQAFYWRKYADAEVGPAVERYVSEARRLYGVLEGQLSRSAFVAGQEYSIADIAIFPWLETHSQQGVDLGEFPSIAAWREKIAARPAVRRGMALLAESYHSGTLSLAERKAVLGE